MESRIHIFQRNPRSITANFMESVDSWSRFALKIIKNKPLFMIFLIHYLTSEIIVIILGTRESMLSLESAVQLDPLLGILNQLAAIWSPMASWIPFRRAKYELLNVPLNLITC